MAPKNEQSSIENLEMLVTVSRLLSSKLDLSDLLQYTMRLASRVVGAERASLFLLDPKTKELYFDVALGLSPEIQKMRFKLGEGVVGTCAKEERSIVVNDVSTSADHVTKVDEQSGFVTRSLLSCPMVVKGNVIGVVQALNKTEGVFTEADVKNFEAFASQAAIAIENARLYSSLREEKRRLQFFFSETQEGAILSDTEGNVLLANKAAGVYLGRADIMGCCVPEFFKDMEVAPKLSEILSSAEPIVPFEASRKMPKHLFLGGVAIRLHPGEDGQGKGWLWLFRDVTSQKANERMARSFLSLISHKLKTPMAVLTGYCDMLQAPTLTPQQTAMSTAQINKQCKKLAGLVEQLLNFVELDDISSSSLRQEGFDAGEFGEKLAADWRERLTETGASVKVQAVFSPAALLAPTPIAPAAPQVPGFAILVNCPQPFSFNCDRRLLAAAVNALVENALKFNDKPLKKVTIFLSREGGRDILAVSDNGTGIPPEEQGRIFQKFYQVEASFTGQVDGWGLGLAFVQQVAHAHGGEVTVRSVLKEGSTITIALPHP